MAPSRYPNKDKAEVLWLGFGEGFRIPAPDFVVPGATRNLLSAYQHSAVVAEKLGKEVALGRMAGPFQAPPFPDLVVSPLGVVPKKEPGKFRLIHHLSYPRGRSVNDGIPAELCSVVYTSFDEAIRWVKKCGKGALMAKTDIESAFRLLPVHSDCVRLLGCFWEGAYFVDRCLPMGCSISCAFFETFSSFLEWVVRDVSGLSALVHYLDDFLCVGPADSAQCAGILATVEWVADRFGVPLAPEKTVGPTTSLSFLEHKADLAVWGQFLEYYNGRSLLMEDVVDNFDLELFTDAAGSSDFGAFFQGISSALDVQREEHCFINFQELLAWI
ncbi:uncharacterized protein ACNLHF_028199 [Anomaloglossus baeobatrachus]